MDKTDLAAAPDLDARLAAVQTMSWSELRACWRDVTGRPLPRVKQALLRHALAWEMQAAVYGGLSRRSQQYLDRLGDPARPAPVTGKRLVREWKGVLHTVTIADDGVIQWKGETWKSLSEVARAITGTRWSGPVFFGLKERSKAA